MNNQNIDNLLYKKLYIIWDVNKYTHNYYDHYVKICSLLTNKVIIINNEQYTHYISLLPSVHKRKNCMVENNNYKTIYFNENYIKSIIRHKYINNLLND